jgi:hypothetical protein
MTNIDWKQEMAKEKDWNKSSEETSETVDITAVL